MTIYNLPPAKSNHYLNRYIKLITYYCKINFEGYTETHHILPKSMGGTDDKSNLIVLSARLHYIAHWLLYRAYKNQSMSYAFLMLHSSNKKQKRYFNSRAYESIKSEYSLIQQERMKGSNNSFFGKTHSEESKLKMGETKRKNGFKPWNTGIEMPDEIKLSISKAKENYKWWTNGKEEIQSDICPNGWNPGRTLKFSHSDEYKEYMKKLYSNGKMNWWNNGIINKRQKEKPIGDEWVRGRLFSKDLYDKFCKNKGS